MVILIKWINIKHDFNLIKNLRINFGHQIKKLKHIYDIILSICLLF